MAQCNESWSDLAVASAVPAFRRHISVFASAANLSDPPMGDVRLAVSEGVTNVVLHSYRDREEPGPVEMAATLTQHELKIVIADEGTGMRPRDDSPGLGLGLPIIGTVTQGFEIRPREPEGSELHLRFSF